MPAIYGPILMYLISKFLGKIEKYKTRKNPGFGRVWTLKNPKPGFAKFRVFGKPYFKLRSTPFKKSEKTKKMSRSTPLVFNPTLWSC